MKVIVTTADAGIAAAPGVRTSTRAGDFLALTEPRLNLLVLMTTNGGSMLT